MEYFADVRKEKTDQITIIKQNDLNFDIEFDYDYFVDKGKLKIENYNFIIVDGIIDTVGEIHHLLQINLQVDLVLRKIRCSSSSLDSLRISSLFI